MSDALYVKVGDSVEALDLGTSGGTAPEYVERIEALESGLETVSTEALGVKADTVLAAETAADVSGGSLGTVDLNEILGAYEQTQNALTGYLPLTGGRMTGSLTLNGKIFLNSIDTDIAILFGEQDEGTTPRIIFRGSKRSYLPGSIDIIAHNSDDKLSAVQLRPDGTFTLDNNPIVVLTDSWRSGGNWYRKYSDGWIEQGGNNWGQSLAATNTVTFNIAFTKTSPTVVLGGVGLLSTGSYESGIKHDTTPSKTGFTVIGGAGGTDAKNCTYWYACGY